MGAQHINGETVMKRFYSLEENKIRSNLHVSLKKDLTLLADNLCKPVAIIFNTESHDNPR